MSLPFEKPDPSLLRELRAVARRAGEFERALEESNILPEDFPKEDARALIVTLEALPDGTAEGCKEPLRFAEDRLAEIVRDHILIEDDEEGAAPDADLPEDPDAPPELTRGGRVEQAASLLISAITIARSEYFRQAGEAEEDEPPERGITPNAQQAETLGELDARGREVQAEARDLQAELDNPEHFNATDAVEDLKRQSKDAETHIDLVRQTARQPVVRPSTLARLGGVIRKIPDAMEATGRGLQKGIDVLEPFANQWFNQIPTDIYNLVLKQLRLFADNVGAAGKVLKGDGPSKPSWTPGHIFRDVDAPWCPEMVVIPAGSFTMGSPESEEGHDHGARPQHEVTLARSFALGRYTITFDQYDHYCLATGRDLPGDVGWGRGRRPVINVSYVDAEAYLAWLSETLQASYRLPSEAEWEYACRAGTTTRYSCGDEINKTLANCDSLEGNTVEVGSYAPNAFGLYDMHGNVREWCADQYYNNYVNAPTDGSVRPRQRSGWFGKGESQMVLRGGGWINLTYRCASAYRQSETRDRRTGYIGFRAARTLD
jgi:formylglycine-generating enzyme required for sulfatase activity